MHNTKGVDLSNLPSIYSKRKTRKCSSCKCLKPMDQFLPITVNKKTVIPKTCQYCRSRRNSYYWNFESKKPRTENINTRVSPSTDVYTPMPIGYIEKPKPLTSTLPIYNTNTDVALPSLLQTPSVNKEPEDPVPAHNDSELYPLPLSPLDDEYQFREDELGPANDYGLMKRSYSMDGLPDDVDSILVELQRQTVHSMMNELMNIGDILAAGQLDIFNSQETIPDLNLDDIPITNEI